MDQNPQSNADDNQGAHLHGGPSFFRGWMSLKNFWTQIHPRVSCADPRFLVHWHLRQRSVSAGRVLPWPVLQERVNRYCNMAARGLCAAGRLPGAWLVGDIPPGGRPQQADRRHRERLVLPLADWTSCATPRMKERKFYARSRVLDAPVPDSRSSMPAALAVATRDRTSSSVLINVRISRRSRAVRCLVGGDIP